MHWGRGALKWLNCQEMLSWQLTFSFYKLFQDFQVEEGEQETESEVEEEEIEKPPTRRAGRKARVEIEYEEEREPKRAKLKA